MQNRPTYTEQYNKVIDAYFKNEIRPFDTQFCFCGTLCGNTRAWHNRTSTNPADAQHNNYEDYTGIEYVRMEISLLEPIANITKTKYGCDAEGADNYEDAMFTGMAAALDVLKQIHIEGGEVIEETPVFTKRQLQMI